MRRPAALAAVFVLSVAGMVAARALGSGPALYDGLCLPVQYAQLGANPSPGSLDVSVTPDATNQFPTTVLTTNESPPQAQAIISSGTFPSSQLPVRVTIAAVTPPATPPSDGALDGNVYRYAATGRDGTALQPAAGKPVTVALEAPPSSGANVTVELWDGSAWTALQTQVGNCGTLFEAVTQKLGDLALVRTGASATATPGSSGSGSSSQPTGAPVALIVGAAVIVGVAILAASIGRRRRPRPRRR